MIGNFSKLETNSLNAQFKLNNTIQKLRAQVAHLKSKCDVIDTQKPQGLDSQTFQLQNAIQQLNNENKCLQAENTKVKHHYKELYDSIKITRDSNNVKIAGLLKEI